MNVHVAPGAAFIPGTETTTQGVYGVYVDASVAVPIAAADATNPRISLIVLQVLDAGYSGSSNIGQAIEVAGVPASSPVAPAVPKNSIVLAQVLVAHSVTSITSSAITDERAFITPNTSSQKNPAATNFTTSSASAVELDTTLRTTVNVGRSGIVDVEIVLSGVYATGTAGDVYVATQVDSGGWINCGAFPYQSLNIPIVAIGRHRYTGLTPGSHTFYVGWASVGGGTLNLSASSRGASLTGSWHLVKPL